MARPPGALNKRTRAALSAASEGKLGSKAEKTIDYLLSIANDPKTEHSLRVQAANAALPYCKPRLAAIEQTNVEPRDQLTAAEIEAKVAATFAAEPEKLERLVTIALNAAPELRGRLLALLNSMLSTQQSDSVAPLTH